jgi:chorismate mutase
MQDNPDVIHALAQGEVDAAVSDTREAVIWQEENPGLRTIGPFTRDRKAFLVAAGRPELARELDAWLLESQADGRLDALRAKALGEPPNTTTTTKPLWALLAAVDERLSLMPWVAEAKRAGGGPIEVPSVEARVLEEAIIRFRAALEENPGQVKRNESRVLDFYRAQIEAAKSIQRQTLSAPSVQGNEPIPDLASSLRPALLRINDRIATLLVALPAEVSEKEIEQATRQELISTNLPDRDLASLAAALIALTSPEPNP